MPPAKQKQTKRVMGARLRATLMVILVLAALVTAAFLSSYVFEVEEISVSGNKNVQAEQIIQLSGIQLGDHALLVRKDKLKEKIEADPYLVFEKTKLVSPSHIQIIVTERVPVAAIRYGGSFVWIDKEGIVLETSEFAGELLSYDKVTLNAAMAGQVVQGLDQYQIASIAALSEALGKSEMREEFTNIDISNPTVLTIETEHNIRVRLGTTDDLDKKVQWIDTVLPRCIDEGKNFGVLDVSSGTGASYIPDE